MKIQSTLQLAMQAIVKNPTRAFLTIMGVTWGIMSFMILMAYGQGFQRALMIGLNYFGDNVIVVWNGQTSKQAGGQKAGRAVIQERSNVEMIRRDAIYIKRVSGEVFRRYKADYDQRTTTAGIRAVESCYGVVRGMFIQDGRFFTDEENRQMSRVAVLGSELKQKLFSQIPAVGKDIKIKGIRFTVVGVLRKKIALSNYFEQDDDCIMIPINTMEALSSTRYLSVMVWQPLNPSLEAKAKQEFMTLMGTRHKFEPDDEKALFMHSYSDVKNILDGFTMAVRITVLLVGIITLGIGGMGVMNIMLLSVKSRTREIGTMMALGARRRNIVFQFLCETLLMSLAGGVVGFLFAWLVTLWLDGIPFLSNIFRDKTKQGDIYLVLTSSDFLVSMGFLCVVSLVFGLWPARQAARLDPIEALRYE